HPMAMRGKRFFIAGGAARSSYNALFADVDVIVGVKSYGMRRTKSFALALFPATFSLTFDPRWAEDGPVSLKDGPGRMVLPPGFRVTLFAGEPDVRQPIAFPLDDRGRLWVVECYSYPDWRKEGQDRIIVFEDKDGDGHFDRRFVFWDKGANLTGI